MTFITWIIGLAISAWIGAMGIGAIIKTDSAKKWFGEMLGQSPVLMTINGIGLFLAAALVALNLFMPTIVNSTFVKWALVGIGVAQLSSLFMLIRGGASSATMAGPVVLLILSVTYWFIGN